MNSTTFAAIISLISVIVTVIGTKLGEAFLEWLKNGNLLKVKDKEEESFAQKELVRQLTDELKNSREETLRERKFGEMWRDKYYELLVKDKEEKV